MQNLTFANQNIRNKWRSRVAFSGIGRAATADHYNCAIISSGHNVINIYKFLLATRWGPRTVYYVRKVVYYGQFYPKVRIWKSDTRIYYNVAFIRLLMLSRVVSKLYAGRKGRKTAISCFIAVFFRVRVQHGSERKKTTTAECSIGSKNNTTKC